VFTGTFSSPTARMDMGWLNLFGGFTSAGRWTSWRCMAGLGPVKSSIIIRTDWRVSASRGVRDNAAAING